MHRNQSPRSRAAAEAEDSALDEAPAPLAALPRRLFLFANPGAQPVPFARLRDEFLALYKPPLRRPKTYAKSRLALDQVAALLGPDGTTDALTPALIQRLIASQPPSNAHTTTNSLLRCVAAACKYAQQVGYLGISPFLVRKLTLPERKPEYRQHHSREEIARVLALAEADIARKARHKQGGPWCAWKARRLHALVTLVAYTGLRKMEALCLKVEDLNLESRWLRIVARKENPLKTQASERSVPIPGPLALVLADWLHYNESEWVFPNSNHDAPWTGGSPTYTPLSRIKALGRRCGIPDLTFLSLRHSFATHAESAWGFTDEQIARYLGHSNTKTQRHYRHEDKHNLRALSRTIRFGASDAADSEETEPTASVSWAPPPKPQSKPAARRRDLANRPKLTDEQALECRQLRAKGWQYPDLAARYGIQKSTLHSLLIGATYRHVPMPGAGGGAHP